MKSSVSKIGASNTVVADRQWIRRVKQEEINMIDSFSGSKLDAINRARESQNKNHFYPQHTRMNNSNTTAAAAASKPHGNAQSNREENKSEAPSRVSRARDSDGLDSVSQVSVTTPKSRSGRENDSVSFVSA